MLGLSVYLFLCVLTNLRFAVTVDLHKVQCS